MIPPSDKHLTKHPSTDSARPDDRSDADFAAKQKDGVQGEGNYKAARQFNDAERQFVASGKVAAAARAAAPKSEAERKEMIAAEHEGKRRAKEEDPALAKPLPASATPAAPGKASGRTA